MPHVTVNIGGRPYRLACEEGEEAHLEHLSGIVESKIEAYRGSFGEIGDQRIAVMAAITLADELVEAQRRIEILQTEAQAHKMMEIQHHSHQDVWVNSVADSLVKVAERIETSAAMLNGANKG